MNLLRLVGPQNLNQSDSIQNEIYVIAPFCKEKFASFGVPTRNEKLRGEEPKQEIPKR